MTRRAFRLTVLLFIVGTFFAACMAALLPSKAHAATSAQLLKLQDQVLAPSVQVEGSGLCSGTVIFSGQPDPAKTDIATYILSAAHCVDDSRVEYLVKVPVYQDNVLVKWDAYVATLKGQSAGTDLAVFALRDFKTKLPHVAKLAPMNLTMFEGEDVWTVGFSLGMSRTVTSGLFGNVETVESAPAKGNQFYRATPAIAPGNSGGSMWRINEKGDFELIGVTSMGVTRFFFMNYYVRAKEIREYLKAIAPIIDAAERKNLVLGIGSK